MTTKHIILILFFVAGVEKVAAVALPFPYGAAVGDNSVGRSDDAYSEVDVPTTNFYGSSFTKVFIDTNGAMFLNNYCHTCNVPQPFPVIDGRMMVACYWADADPTQNAASQVYYRVSTDNQDWITAQTYLQGYINTVSLDMSPTNPARRLIIATWLNLTYAGGSASTPTNTFQCAIVADGNSSYVIFAYEQLTWTTGRWDPDNYAWSGIDNGEPFGYRNNLTLPYSATNQSMQLALSSNFPPKFRATPPAGWNAFKATAVQPKPVQYTIPANTPVRTCPVTSDPHYTSFDGIGVWDLFRPAIYWVTQMQESYEWFIMAATSDCHPSNYPPFAVMLTPVPANGMPQPAGPNTPTMPGGLKVIFYMSALHLHTKYSNLDLTITLGDGSFEVCIGPVSPMNCDNFVSEWHCPVDLCWDKQNNVRYQIDIAQSRWNGYTIDASTIGFHALYYKSYAEVTLPMVSDLQDNVFGYCGNMDGRTFNDGHCWTSSLQGPFDYKNCWKESYLTAHQNLSNPGRFACSNYPSMVNVEKKKAMMEKAMLSVDPKRRARELRQNLVGQSQCNIMKDTNGPFRACQGLPSLQNQYDMCAGDVGLTNGDNTVLCNALDHLATSCAIEFPGTVVSWRSAGLCPPSCPSNSHWSDSTTSCPNSCDNPIASQMCSDPPTSNCECNQGYIRNGNECILPEKCSGCLSDSGSVMQVGDVWTSKDCSQNCSCHANSSVACTPVSCDSHATCQSTPLGPTCNCSDGYFGNGYFCSAIDRCQANNCQNGATCVSGASSYQCTCAFGYTGQYCDQVINNCASTPCQNGASCVNSLGSYSCTCGISYAGPNCQYLLDPCASFPCENLATCISNLTAQSWACVCPPGFQGIQCENETTTTAAPTTVAPTTPGDINCKVLPNGPYPIPGARCSRQYYWCWNGDLAIYSCSNGQVFFINKCLPHQNVPGC